MTTHALARAVAFRLACAAALGTALLLPGCASDPSRGYSFASTTPSAVRSIAVPIFQNNTFEMGLEAELTEAIIKEIQRSPGLVVAGQDAADTLLTGLITSADLRRVSLDSRTGLAQELSYTITVDFDWKDRRGGRVLTARRSFAATDTFVPGGPTAEPIATGRRGAAQRLARDIVAQLQSDW
jgi:hypothetical protein